MDRIILYKSNISRRQSRAAYDEPLYHICLYDYKFSDDTWDPTSHLQRSEIVSYYKEKKLKIPNSIEDEIYG